MRRRDFIVGIAGLAAGWPHATRAQQNDQVRRMGLLMPYAMSNAEAQASSNALLCGLRELGWIEGRNLEVEYRFAGSGTEDLRIKALELAALQIDVIIARATPAVIALATATKKIPIVFTVVNDPVGAGFVDSLARPGRNATGFTQFDYSISGKWLELLKEIAPQVTRVGVLREPGLTAAVAQFAVIQSVAPSLRVEPVPLNVRDTNEIEQAVRTFARPSGDGLIVVSSPLTIFHRELIIRLAAQHSLPAVYYERVYATGGGLVSYGPDFREQFRRAAGYIDRILKGEKPADLPVQAPTKYEVVINLKTAKALGLEVPPTLLARADEVIE
jgi:putative tryptophan/tyrosine transport system substrate-binding protein